MMTFDAKREENSGQTFDRKFDLWERKLYDLSLRSALLNVRPSGNALFLHVQDVFSFLPLLETGTSFSVRELAPEQQPEPDKLYGELTEKQSGQKLERLFRAARTAAEETGSSNLYFGIGLLKWRDKKSAGEERLAPLFLLNAEITKGAGAQRFTVCAQGEEPLINHTLLEKLRLDYGLHREDLASFAEGADGERDYREMFTRFRALIGPMNGWEILDTLCVGIFSYAKYMIWEDLHFHREEIGRSPVVRSLLGGTIGWKEEMGAWRETFAGEEVLSPVSLDGSQLLAVQAAAQGKSFVLHGPPGTGKSQTITAIIANALARGQTVLFVAEKMAALSVVQKRLEELGLGDFCLELYSRKTSKKELLRKLEYVSRAEERSSEDLWHPQEELLAQKTLELEKYREHLHMIRPCGMSVWQLMELRESFPEDIPVLEIDGAKAAALTYEERLQRKDILEQLTAAGRSAGHPHGHPLAAVGESEYTQEYRVQMEDKIAAYLQALDVLDKALAEYEEKTGEPRPRSWSEIRRTGEIMTELDRWKDLPEEWAQRKDLAEHLGKAIQIGQHYQNLIMCRERLLKVFTPEILDIAAEEADELRADWDRTRKAWALPRYLGKRRLEAALAGYTAEGKKVVRRRLGQYTQDIQYYQREYILYKEALEAFGKDLTLFSENGRLSVGKMMKTAAIALRSAERLRALTGSDSVRLEKAGKENCRKEITVLAHAFLDAREKETELQEFLKYRDGSRSNEAEEEDWFAARRKFCALLKEHGSELREWMLWNRIRTEAENIGLQRQVEAYRDGMDHDMVVPSFEKSWVISALREEIEKDPVLNGFSGTLYEEMAASFRELEKEVTSLAAQEIRRRLLSRMPDFVQDAYEDPSLSLFQKILLGGGRGMTVREILGVLAPLLRRLCPCMLMSPVSCAQYLDLSSEPFDIVVFDEASQITSACAAGALARGRSAIIAGDPNQMPPTSFFVQEVGIPEDPLTDDLGSILEDCIAANLPQLYLSWHYRSRHESLIAFSNRFFYGGRLCTFPSADDARRMVRSVYVNGRYDAGASRTNREEAEAVVKELLRRSSVPGLRDKSVGIITFNVQQEQLIEDLYDRALQGSESLRRWEAEAKEPLFIKNLENVQGDERDVILFSTTYGPSGESRMSLNLGPLNREGGWKRLNVAVTRSREEMLIFTSVPDGGRELERSASRGVRMLGAFLRYAAEGTMIPEAGEVTMARRSREKDGAVAQTLCDMLCDRGLDAVCGVGRSSMRVDVAVEDTSEPGRYALGILLDGTPLREDRTIRDMEAGRIRVLEGLGWKLFPLHAVDWYDDRGKAVDAVCAALQEKGDTRYGR